MTKNTEIILITLRMRSKWKSDRPQRANKLIKMYEYYLHNICNTAPEYKYPAKTFQLRLEIQLFISTHIYRKNG